MTFPFLRCAFLCLILLSCKSETIETASQQSSVAEPETEMSIVSGEEDVEDATKAVISEEEREKAAKAISNSESIGTREEKKVETTEVTTTIATPTINVKGSMEDIRKGDFATKANLSSLEGKKSMYAIGELEGLKGEVTVINGTAYVSRKDDQSIETLESFDAATTLLVSSQVLQWRKLILPKQVQSPGQLRIFMLQQARALGIDVSQPFPFMIEGNMRKLNFHVVHWKEEYNNPNPDVYFKSGYQAVMYNQELQMIGFFSETDDKPYLVGNQPFHAHFVTKNKEFSGHVDEVFLGQNMILKLPIK